MLNLRLVIEVCKRQQESNSNQDCVPRAAVVPMTGAVGEVNSQFQRRGRVPQLPPACGGIP